MRADRWRTPSPASRPRLIIINAEPTPFDQLADEVIREPIGTALPTLLRKVGAESDSPGRR